MKRASGVLMHVSSLWGDYSEGSFGQEAVKWIDFLSECGFSYWQTLPFCLTDDYNSPYQSYSAFSVNPFFIDLPSLNDMGLLTDAELSSAKQNTPYSCEFDRLKKERFELLAKAAQRFTDKAAIAEFMKNHKQSEQFCRYMSLKEVNDKKAWYDWYNDVPDESIFSTWEFIIYIFFKQWYEIKAYANKKGINIIGDIPIYVALDSSDVWANPSQFQLDKDNKPIGVAGVPPDYFCADGQLWGNPLYDWDKMKNNGYSWWKERMRFMAELFDGVRIDHFRGLESYYFVPADETTARNGEWKKGPGMDLINALKETYGDRLIIAEDLGDITDEVRTLVEESSFPGMRVLQFGFLGDGTSPHLPHNYENNCVAYTGTHDNNTLLGYVWEISENDRRRLMDYCGYSGSDWNNCYNSILRTMFASHAGLLMLPIQDLLLYGSDTRLNTPGKCNGNWGFRITEEQLKEIDKDKFVKWNTLYGRR